MGVKLFLIFFEHLCLTRKHQPKWAIFQCATTGLLPKRKPAANHFFGKFRLFWTGGRLVAMLSKQKSGTVRWFSTLPETLKCAAMVPILPPVKDLIETDDKKFEAASPFCSIAAVKIAFGILAGLFVVNSVLAQSSVAFANGASVKYRIWTNNAAGNASNLMSGVNAYRIGLYAAPGRGQPEGSLSLVALATNAAVFPGYFNGGFPLYLSAPFFRGDTITFQIRAWSHSAGFDYASAVATQNRDPLNVALGQSPVGFTVLGGSIYLPGDLFGTNPGQLSSGFEVRPAPGLTPVPEPSSMALAVLGLAASALFFRRSKRPPAA